MMFRIVKRQLKADLNDQLQAIQIRLTLFDERFNGGDIN